MKFLILCAVLSGFLLSLNGPAQAFTQIDGTAACYVAPNGSDDWSGNLPEPNPARTDGPYKTIAHAVSAAGSSTRDVKNGIPIHVESGLYQLTEPITFDSATAARPITIEADGGAKPILSGGERITGWRNVGGNRWQTILPDVAAGKWYFSQLYVDGARRYRPRLPLKGYYTVAAELPPSPKAAGKGYDRFRYAPGDIDPAWTNQSDITVDAFQVWDMSELPIAKIDPAQRVVTFTGMIGGNSAWSHLPAGRRYLVDNVKEALSQPGQWYLDRGTGVLTYLALPGEDPNKIHVVAPRLETLVQMDGAANVQFRGLTFSDCAWNVSPNGGGFPQSCISIPAAISLTHCHDVAFTNCTVRNIGTYGVSFGDGTQHCTLDHCLLYDLGAGGVKIGSMQYDADASTVASFNTVQDCRIIGCGRIHPAGAGVWIGHSSHNTVTHNEIADTYQIAVSAGWSWGYGPNGAHDNTISYNDIHQIGQRVLSDMGGIYTLGVSPGTLLDHNRISDIHTYDYGGWGIYFDEGSSGITATNNVVFDCQATPFNQHYGTDNIVENNIFALGDQGQLNYENKSNDPHHSPAIDAKNTFTFRQNIVFADDAPFFAPNWSTANTVLQGNLYWDTTGAKNAMRFPENTTLASWQAKGFDSGSIEANPLFADPRKGDFNLREGSPASKIGFAPIDISTVGPRDLAPFKDDMPRAFPAAAPPKTLEENCEEYIPGDEPGDALHVAWTGPGVVVAVDGRGAQSSIRVTDETAAGGKQSIKVTDSGGAEHHDPYVYYNTALSHSTAVGAFSVRLEKGAAVDQEWRDNAAPFVVGPSLHIGPDGTLTVGGRDLAKLPLDTWLRFTVTCPLGAKASGSFDLTVQPADSGAPLHFTALPCAGGAAFQHLNWWGFSSDSAGPSSFYLDDLSLHETSVTPN